MNYSVDQVKLLSCGVVSVTDHIKEKVEGGDSRNTGIQIVESSNVIISDDKQTSTNLIVLRWNECTFRTIIRTLVGSTGPRLDDGA